MHLEIMIIWQFISIYISEFVAKIIANKNYILFAIIYVFTFCLLNQINLKTDIPIQHFQWQMIIIPILAVFLSRVNISLNENFIDSLVVESLSASIVEELLFRKLIPANFSNKITGIIVSGILFAIIHIKNLNMDISVIIRVFIASFLFNVLMFEQKPNNFLAHFLWNFITITCIKTDNIDGSSITPIEISNSTIIILLLSCILNF